MKIRLKTSPLRKEAKILDLIPDGLNETIFLRDLKGFIQRNIDVRVSIMPVRTNKVRLSLVRGDSL